jgi:hypothetical protein
MPPKVQGKVGFRLAKNKNLFIKALLNKKAWQGNPITFKT